MDLAEIVLIAIGLALDASAVSLVAAASGYAKDARASFRLSFHFGLFQFIMPVIGWAVGNSFIIYFTSIAHWIAFILLVFVGGRMVLSGLATTQTGYKQDPSRGYSLILLSLATSIDALAIGLSLAMLNVDIWYPSVIIGLITAVLSLLAIRIGKRVGRIIGNRMAMALIHGGKMCPDVKNRENQKE